MPMQVDTEVVPLGPKTGLNENIYKNPQEKQSTSESLDHLYMKSAIANDKERDTSNKLMVDLFSKPHTYPEGVFSLTKNVGGIEFVPKNFNRLQPDMEFDDHIINGFASVMSEVARSKGTPIMILSTQLSTMLIIEGSFSVGYKRWAVKFDLPSYKTWLLPVHISFGKDQGHWTLFVISFQYKTIYYLDSLHNLPETMWIQRIMKFIQMFKRENIEWDEWDYVIPNDIPSQKSKLSRNNCGTHVCCAMYTICTGTYHPYVEGEMNNVRKAIAFVLATTDVQEAKPSVRIDRKSPLPGGKNTQLCIKDEHNINTRIHTSLGENFPTIRILSAIHHTSLIHSKPRKKPKNYKYGKKSKVPVGLVDNNIMWTTFIESIVKDYKNLEKNFWSRAAAEQKLRNYYPDIRKKTMDHYVLYLKNHREKILGDIESKEMFPNITLESPMRETMCERATKLAHGIVATMLELNSRKLDVRYVLNNHTLRVIRHMDAELDPLIHKDYIKWYGSLNQDFLLEQIEKSELLRQQDLAENGDALQNERIATEDMAIVENVAQEPCITFSSTNVEDNTFEICDGPRERDFVGESQRVQATHEIMVKGSQGKLGSDDDIPATNALRRSQRRIKNNFNKLCLCGLRIFETPLFSGRA
ncbi:hypothetical protein QAD02_003415 [Eretmocerus hayati]|uniref:Uncharacterized protein n=1 Tax=Eretmocerus hayati TaxID=131215 RepID=A0ACC2NM08_9HYME|nr:hypothetical protein QAD02_003415 [Eretmocerus hayati]